MRRRTTAWTIAAISLALLAAGCGSGSSGSGSSGGGKGKLTVASFNFAESQVLAAMFAEVLDKAGYDASVKPLTTREIVEPALEDGQVDVVPEYVGTLTEFLNTKANGPNPKPLASNDLAKTTDALRALATKRGITILDPSRATDQNAFAVTKEFADKHKLAKLSDLARYKGKLVLGAGPECPKRPFCQLGLQQVYGIKFSGFKALDPGGPLTKQALRSGQIQVGLVFTSDPAIKTMNFVVLADDKRLQTVDNVVPAVNTKAASPEVKAALNRVMAALTTDDLIELNRKVIVDHQDPAEVAKAWLKSKNLA